MKTIAVYDAKPYDRQFLDSEAKRFDGKIHLQFHEFRLSADTVAAAGDAEAVCVFVNDRLDADCLRRLGERGVRMIALRCAGYNNVDLDAARGSNLVVTRVPAYSPHAVAEHTVALLMTLNRRIHRAYNRVREHNFSLSGLVGFDVAGKTVGIIGTGRIGRITGQIFRGFGCEVIAFDAVPDREWAAANGIEYADQEVLLRRSDIVSLHVPLTAETRHLLRRETMAIMKPGAVIVNTSRGKLIDTKALIDALKRGRLAGVALDVYEEEEGVFFEDLSDQVLQDDELTRLLTFPNVLITAHQAFLTREALQEIARVTLENIVSHMDGGLFLEGTQLC